MMLNVWGMVWRMQKKIIRWTSGVRCQGHSHASRKRQERCSCSLLATRLSFWLSFPMLFFMGAASHYMMFRRVVMPPVLPPR